MFSRRTAFLPRRSVNSQVGQAQAFRCLDLCACVRVCVYAWVCVCVCMCACMCVCLVGAVSPAPCAAAQALGSRPQHLACASLHPHPGSSISQACLN